MRSFQRHLDRLLKQLLSRNVQILLVGGGTGCSEGNWLQSIQKSNKSIITDKAISLVAILAFITGFLEIKSTSGNWFSQGNHLTIKKALWLMKKINREDKSPLEGTNMQLGLLSLTKQNKTKPELNSTSVQ